MRAVLDFEKKIVELEDKITELQHLSHGGELNIAEEVNRLQNKIQRLLAQTYADLTPWQKVQIARHPERPQFLDYVNLLITDFTPLAGDRLYAEDQAIIGGLGRFNDQPVMIMGHQKGKDTADRLKHNFGMAKPEGYRKAQRLMKLADHYHLPIITLVDTAGAYPGIDAEERGQAEAIARAIDVCLEVKVPLISVIIGEGGSGGAIAIATGNRVSMLEHSVYSVISPEGCASILWRSKDKREEAAEAQKLTAEDLLALHIIDEIIPEPLGGAHRDPKTAIQNLGSVIQKQLQNLKGLNGAQLHEERRQKFLKMGRF